MANGSLNPYDQHDEQPTCGKGLADHSTLPAGFANVLAAVRENLELHLTSLDPGDPSSKPEYDAYVALVAQHRELAGRLQALAAQMAGYRDLPMAAHDGHALASPRLLEAFQRLVKEEEALLTLLKDRVAQHRAMLKGWTENE